MPYKSPVDHRTPRNIALERAPAGSLQSGDLGYDTKAGVPMSKSGGVAADNVGATFRPSAASGVAERLPFTKLTSGKE